jgi:hypothetical protein
MWLGKLVALYHEVYQHMYEAHSVTLVIFVPSPISLMYVEVIL